MKTPHTHTHTNEPERHHRHNVAPLQTDAFGRVGRGGHVREERILAHLARHLDRCHLDRALLPERVQLKHRVHTVRRLLRVLQHALQLRVGAQIRLHRQRVANVVGRVGFQRRIDRRHQMREALLHGA